jgi:hypothetical protein
MQQEKTHPDLSLFLITQLAITMGDYYQIMRIVVVNKIDSHLQNGNLTHSHIGFTRRTKQHGR